MIERKTFTYDGQNSADFGLYIAGDSVYDAPTRDMDMITIPGRNGQLSIDQGRFENITVTYPCFIWADTQEEFRTKVRAIRNWLCAKTSYFKLSDEYNPESYRLGIYKSGLEVEPIFYNRAGRFELSFDCKPQRFLFSGEEVFTLGEWGETETYSGSIVSFDGTETTAIKSLKVNITPKQSGSGDPSPSNVRPISGWDSVKVTECGKNFAHISQEVIDNDRTTGGVTFHATSPSSVKITGTATSSVFLTTGYPSTSPYLRRLKKGTYTFSTNVKAHGNNGAYITGFPVSGGASQTLANIIHEGQKVTFTINEDFITNIQVQIVSGYTANDDVWFMLEQSNTQSDYTPYNGQTINKSLGQTVYGGTLDLISGVLTVTKAIKNLATDQDGWYLASTTVSGKQRLAVPVNDIKPNTMILSNAFKSVTGLATYVGTEGVGGDGNPRATFYKADLQTVADWKTFATANNLVIVYELATPTTYQLTSEQIETILGVNNIWADAGTVEVEIGENPNILVNPTPFESCPVFEVEGSGTLTVNNNSMTIANNGTTVIDSEMMEAYEEENGAIVSRNDMVSGEFPTLKEGNNNIGAVGLTSVKVTPKWWEV